jgi:hypothetical protein
VWGRQPRACCRAVMAGGWWGFSFFVIFHAPSVGCGWVEHETRNCPVPVVWVWGFGMLLGPEETPARWVGFSWWPSLGPGRLTHPFSLFLGGGGVVVVVVGGGVVVC